MAVLRQVAAPSSTASVAPEGSRGDWPCGGDWQVRGSCPFEGGRDFPSGWQIFKGPIFRSNGPAGFKQEKALDTVFYVFYVES